ncbi:Peroxisomal fatty acid beta-oxidation multifunctional protein AIM1 [Hibiscus syriacus]|uniref:Peroxisomal fatty acid beta-oxidation multifunctional protein AIM1 n=1 Tax=Hibiscus syriacus TaxID=106335 RepID=A0A6A2XD94_HIBSY|nr:Peroxisomal fatty acid beta-oxidation multifunctional protein AIM1 [Hibiscus syriacus]
MELVNDAVAVITTFYPPVNAMTIPVIAGLVEKFDEASRRNDVKAVVLTGDVSVMPDVSVDLVLNAIEECKKPVVAAVEGLALGGGLELATCHGRIAAPKAQLGLPELSLGVIPGLGGTQRLPRLIGLQKAIEIMLSSKPIMSEEGKKLGLIDAIVPSEETDKIGPVSEAKEVIRISRQARTAPNLPRQACLDVIEEGIVHGGWHGILKEVKVAKTSRHCKRSCPRVLYPAWPNGIGITTALTVSDIFVLLKEVNSEYLQKGIKKIQANVGALVSRGKLTKDKAEKALSMLKGVLDY